MLLIFPASDFYTSFTYTVYIVSTTYVAAAVVCLNVSLNRGCEIRAVSGVECRATNGGYTLKGAIYM